MSLLSGREKNMHHEHSGEKSKWENFGEGFGDEKEVK